MTTLTARSVSTGPTGRDRTLALPRLAAYAAVAAGFALVLVQLGQDSLWSDEIVTARLARQALPGVWSGIQSDPNHFPLYYLLQWLFAFAGTSEWGLRLPSAFAATASVAAVFWLGRELRDERSGVAAAALLATHPAHLWAGQEARYYAVVGLAAALSAAGLLSLVHQPRPRAAVAFVLGTLAGVSTHFFCFVMAAVEAAYCAGTLVLGRRKGPSRQSRWLLACGITIAALSLPLVPYVLRLLRAEGGGSTPMVTRATILELWYEYGARSQSLKYAFLVLAAIAVFVVARSRPAAAALSLLWFAPVPLLMLPKATHFFLAKYMYYLFPMYIALAGVGLAACLAQSRCLRSAKATPLLLLVALVNVPSLITYYQAEKFDWRDAAAYLASVAGPEDAIITLPPTEPEMSWYYLPHASGAPVVGFAAGQQTIAPLLAVGSAAQDVYWVVLLPSGSLPDSAALAQAFDITAFYGVAVLHSRLPVLEAAAEILPRFAAACGNDAVLAGPAWDTAGAVLEALGRTEGARLAYGSALSFHREERVQHRLRGDIARLSGDLLLAQSEYEAAIAAVPDLASVYLRLAEVRRASGNGAGAVAAYLAYWRLAQERPSGLCVTEDLLTELRSAQLDTPDTSIDTPYCDGAHPSSCYVAFTRFSLPTTGESRDVLFQHPPTSVTYVIPQSGADTYVASAPLLDPQAWGWGGDGVTFRLLASGSTWKAVLGEKEVTAQAQGWEDWVLPLPSGTTHLRLQTDAGPAGDASADWAGWGTPLVVTLCNGG